MKVKVLNNTYLSMFCSELAMLLDAGLSLSDSVQVIGEDEHSKEAKTIMSCLYDSLMLGNQFATALKEASVFPKYMVHMVEVGEKTGRLVQTLTALSEYYDRQTRLSVTIKNSVLYPAILLILMIVVVLILIVQVLPIFNDIFGRMGTQMDPFAIRLMQFGGWLGNAAIGIALVFSAIFITILILFAVPAIRKWVTQVFTNKWGNRGVFGKIASSRFIFAMSLGMASGLDIAESVNIASAVSGGSKAVDAMHKKCVALLESGKTLSESLSESGILSKQDSKMLSVGSVSGKADIAIAEIARRSDVDVRDSIDRVVSRIEPTLVILSSVIVGVILLSVMLPLMGIMTSLG
ncbi:MAG: type II secretion system F family protein [Oscillospiraceae bacterium]|nr:type II secretion system F family protein [Oscillospiraceae bacterium]